MRHSIVKVSALLGALAMVTFTAGSSAAATGLASGAYTVADVEEDNVLPAGFESYEEAKKCAWKSSCSDLEDVAYADVDISDEMQDYEEKAIFRVSNGLVSATTLWFVCSYDGNGGILDCWMDGERSWGMRGELSHDARELRLMPIQSAPNEYELRLWVW